MKILFACHRVPFPPRRGGKIRPFNIIRHLTAQGHRVTVASLARNTAEAEAAAGLREHCAQVLLEIIPDGVAWTRMVSWLPSLRPSSFAYFYSPELKRRVASELAGGGYDLAFAHCSSAAAYVEDAGGVTRILDYGDIDSQKWREYSRYRALPLSAGYWLEAVKLERAERKLSDKFDLCTCTTRGELEALRALGVTMSSDWFPNGVDTDFFAPTDIEYDPKLVCFVGRMDYFPNQQAVTRFCETVWPEIRHTQTDAQFFVVGADPPESIRRLARHAGVTVTGSVDDVRPYVRRAALTVAPLQIARGTQNKILESMALGVPVVCSPPASAGVDAVAGEHLVVADEPAAWVEAVTQLLTNPGRRRELATAARARVLSHHSWAASMRRLDALIAVSRDGRRRSA